MVLCQNYNIIYKKQYRNSNLYIICILSIMCSNRFLTPSLDCWGYNPMFHQPKIPHNIFLTPTNSNEVKMPDTVKVRKPADNTFLVSIPIKHMPLFEHVDHAKVVRKGNTLVYSPLDLSEET